MMRSLVGQIIALAVLCLAASPSPAVAQTPGTLFDLAAQRFTAGDTAGALATVRECLAADDRSPGCLYLGTVILRNTGQSEAVAFARRLLALASPGSPADFRGRVHALYASTMIDIGDADEAREHLRRARELLGADSPLLADLEIEEALIRDYFSGVMDRAGRYVELAALANRSRRARTSASTSWTPDPVMTGYETRSSRWHRVAFRVSTVLGQDGAQQRVVIEGDHADMIRRGLEGSAMAVDGRVDGRVPGEIGSVETITDGPAAQVRVRLFDPRTPLVPGDLILLPAAIHWETPPSVFLSLARAGIGFLPQRQGDTFLGTISTNRQLDIPDPRLATAELARAVRTAAFELRSGTIAVPPELTGPLPAGRFGGVTALEAMERTTPADALACLHWLDRHPEGFMGHSWDFADVYATWLVTGAPE